MIRGVRFNPEVPVVFDDWLQAYPAYRSYVVGEMRALREGAPSITHLVVTLVSGRHFAYPNPEPERIANLGAFLADAGAFGFKVIPLIATPCTLPQSFATAAGPPTHVGGHFAGEVVNGWTLFWDVPPCPDGCQITSAAWAATILRGVTTYHSRIEHVEIGGNHSIPFATEAGPFWSDAYKVKVGDYVRTVANALGDEFPALRVGCSIVAFQGLTNQVQFAASPQGAPGLDIYSASCDLFADVPELSASVLGASKLVVADFGFRENLAQPWEVAQWLIAQARRWGAAGWWIWEYRDTGQGGLRHSTANGGAWDMRLIDVIEASA